MCFKCFLFVSILCVSMFCQHVYMCTGTCRDQKKVLDTLELELWMVVGYHVDTGN